MAGHILDQAVLTGTYQRVGHKHQIPNDRLSSPTIAINSAANDVTCLQGEPKFRPSTTTKKGASRTTARSLLTPKSFFLELGQRYWGRDLS